MNEVAKIKRKSGVEETEVDDDVNDDAERMKENGEHFSLPDDVFVSILKIM